MFVASEEDATLSRVDTRTGHLTNSGRYAADGSIARQGDAQLWVASESRGEVSQVETDSLTSFTSLPLPEKKAAAIGVGDGSLWVSTGVSRGGLVTRWQLPAPRTLRFERRYPLRPFDWANGVAFGYGASGGSASAPPRTPSSASMRRVGERRASL